MKKNDVLLSKSVAIGDGFSIAKRWDSSREFKVLATLILSFAWTNNSFAGAALKQVELHHGDEVTLSLDGKIEQSHVTTEYLKDIIQISLNSVTVYPAKVKSSTDGPISKVFVYQYTPKVVRCRISVRGQAESYKKRLQMNFQGKTLHFRVTGASAGTAQESEISKFASAVKQRIVPEGVSLKEEQASLQQKVEQAPLLQEAKGEKVVIKRSSSLGGAKPMPSFGGVFLKLASVVGLFGALAFGLKKVGSLKKVKSSGILSAIQKVSGLQIGHKEGLIQVLSTQHLGPKNSISVVKVAGRTLVLGISQDSIQLITQILDSDEDEELEIAEDTQNAPPAGSPSFAELLGEQKEPPTMMASQGVRSRIRSRLEGLKPL